MKILRIAFLALSIFTLFYSCQKEKSVEVGGGGSVKTDWEFKENKLYKGKIDTAYIEDFGTPVKSLFIEGTSSDGKEALAIEVIGINPSAGATYKTPQVSFEYSSTVGTLYANDVTAIGDFTIVITKIDSASVTGTFTGKVKDTANATKTIVEGKFSAKLNASTSPPPPPQNGQLTLWAKASCTAGGNITIKLSNNQVAAITGFTSTEPTCGAAGTATFSLPAGSYTWKANCGSQDSTSGVITVVANQCVKQEVSFGPATDCHIMDYAFYEASTNTPVYTIRSTFSTSNQVTNIKLIDSTTGDIDNDFNISYPAGKVQIDANQFFLLDASGRVSEFHGYEDPSDNTYPLVIIKYTYNASGYMSQYTLEYVDTPAQIKFKGVMEYTNGNLTKLTENDPSRPTSLRYETTYDYYSSPVKNFISILPLPEITYFQSAINIGKNSQNAVKSETYKSIDPGTGNITTLSLTNYDNYNIGPAPNPYVRNFHISSVGDPVSFKVVLSYKCF